MTSPFDLKKFPANIQREGYTLQLANPFAYTINYAALAPAANPTSGSFQVQNDSDFLWLATSWASDVGGAHTTVSAQTLPLVAVQFLLVSEPFHDSETPLPGVAGSAPREPLPLWVPFWIPGGATFKVQARNYGAAGTTYDLWISFHGLKYKKG